MTDSFGSVIFWIIIVFVTIIIKHFKDLLHLETVIYMKECMAQLPMDEKYSLLRISDKSEIINQ